MIWPWQDRSRRFSWLKASMFALMFAPGIWLTTTYESGEFGTIPLAPLTYWSGLWATALLLLALVVTPLQIIFRWNQLIVVRRMIGVAGLAYTIAHLFIYFALRRWDFSIIGNEMVTRISLIVATASTIGLAALGVTSVDATVRMMGAKGWQKLHNTVYVITGLALIHFLLSPGIYSEQYLMSGMFFWLMAWRMLQRRGLGTDMKALAVLAVASSLFTAFLEAGWILVYQGFEPWGTLGNNFSLILGVSPAWKILILGGFIALATPSRQGLRVRADSFSGRKAR